MRGWIRMLWMWHQCLSRSHTGPLYGGLGPRWTAVGGIISGRAQEDYGEREQRAWTSWAGMEKVFGTWSCCSNSKCMRAVGQRREYEGNRRPCPGTRRNSFPLRREKKNPLWLSVDSVTDWLTSCFGFTALLTRGMCLCVCVHGERSVLLKT